MPALRKNPEWVEGAASTEHILPGPASPGLGCASFTSQAVNKSLSQPLASLTAAKAAGNLGCKVPPRAASLFVGSWEENPSKLRRRKGVPKTELQSRKAISTLLKSLEFLSRENKKQSVNLQLKSLPKSVNNFHIQRIYFSLGFQCKVIQLRKVGPLYCCSQIHMHLFC